MSSASGSDSGNSNVSGSSSDSGSRPNVSDAKSGDGEGRHLKILAVTSCPTGIAHTYMAAEALERAAKKAGHQITIETQGSGGMEKISSSAISSADAVIFAADAAVRERERFAGLPSVEVPVGRAINKPAEVLAEAERAAAEGAREGAPTTAAAATDTQQTETGGGGPGASSKGGTLRQWLMTGVSYMIPFVTAGGILIALAFMFGGAVQVTEIDVYETFTVPALLLKIGQTAFAMLGPILAGFIAYAMADRPGIAPGIVGGLLANEIGAGFLGALVAGLLAGAVIMGLKQVPFPASLRSLLPVLFFPLIGTLIVGTLMILVVGEPIAALTRALEGALEGLSGTNAVLLGLILGTMMAFDMGGPVNKVAYAFGVAGIGAGITAPMAAVMAAGMTPPLGLALATVVRKRLFTKPEQEAGKAAWVMGASFITEGAIPFAAADPLRVIPALMVGSAVAGGLSMVFGATLQAPHGGIFVFPVVNNPLLYVLAIAVGTVVTAVGVVGLKSFHTRATDTTATEQASKEPAHA